MADINIKMELKGIKQFKKRIKELSGYSNKVKMKYAVVVAYKFSRGKIRSKIFFMTKKQTTKMIDDCLREKNKWQDFRIIFTKKSKK